MSLQVWLPLNGDLVQQGLSTSIATNSGATVDNNGKIGKCYSFADNKYISTNYTWASGNTFSIFTWMKKDSKTDGGTLFRTTTKYSPIIDFNGTNGEVRIFYWYNSSNYHMMTYPALEANIWYHVGITYDGTTFCFYIDGEVVKSMAAPSVPYITGTFNIGKADGANFFKGKMNDVRIYDHCLSQKEVQELAKGLVLHYRLAGPGQENLIKASGPNEDGWGINQSGGAFTKTITSECTSFEVTTQATSWFLYYHTFSNLSSVGLKPNTQYTYSFDCKSNQSFTLNIKLLKGNGTSYLTNTKDVRIEGDNEWHRYKVTLTTNATLDISDQYFYMTGGNVLSKTHFRYAKFEEGPIATPWTPHPSDTLWTTMGYSNNIEYDCSGFENNGTKSGQLTWNVDSPRYTTSYKVGLTKAYVDTPNIAFELMPQGTLNIWINRHSSTSDWRQYACFANGYNWTSTEQDFIIIGSTGGTTLCLDCCSNTYVYTPTLNEWHMYTITWDLQQHTSNFYIDGELVRTTTNSRIDTLYASKHNYHAFGNRLSSDVNDYSMSDARIYSTVLSAEAVAELYHSAVIIDNTGKTYAYEYFEAT